MKKRNTGRLGFTLIELLVVVLIIGILAAVALPQYQLSVEKTRIAEALPILRTIANANSVFILANGRRAESMQELDIEMPGADLGYNGRVKSNYFIYDVQSRGTLPSSIAYANRLPHNEVYHLYIIMGDDAIYCQGYSVFGEKVCKQISQNHKTEEGIYKIQ